MGLDGESTSGVARVSVVSNPAARYPETANGDSAASDGLLKGDGAELGDMVAEALRLAGSAGEPGRPLLREWVAPGERVFVLPNLVLHRRVERGETVARFLAKCTNGSIVRPLLEHAVDRDRR